MVRDEKSNKSEVVNNLKYEFIYFMLQFAFDYNVISDLLLILRDRY